MVAQDGGRKVVRGAASLGALVLVLGLGGCQTGGPSAAGDCGPGVLVADPSAIVPGQEVELTGTGFACIDAYYNGRPVTGLPARSAEITWEQGDETISLGEVEIDGQGILTTTVTAPGVAAAGSATIVVETAGVEVTVE